MKLHTRHSNKYQIVAADTIHVPYIHYWSYITRMHALEEIAYHCFQAVRNLLADVKNRFIVHKVTNDRDKIHTISCIETHITSMDTIDA